MLRRRGFIIKLTEQFLHLLRQLQQPSTTMRLYDKIPMTSPGTQLQSIDVGAWDAMKLIPVCDTPSHAAQVTPTPVLYNGAALQIAVA